MRFVLYNGKLMEESTPIFNSSNSSFKYGDGIFETLRVSKQIILLWNYHYERIAKSLELLQISFQTNLKQVVHDSILELCSQNDCSVSARVRLAFFREDQATPGLLIEATALNSLSYEWNQRGWEFDIYTGASKSKGRLSNLKTANHLPYVMAGLHAKQKQLDECLLMSDKGTLADGSRTNVFMIKAQVVYTPPLSAGCVGGVMRRYVLERLPKLEWKIEEHE
ncbi:MAG: aminotransferase class IV, partial [Chitinophagaceae bacterium]